MRHHFYNCKSRLRRGRVPYATKRQTSKHYKLTSKTITIHKSYKLPIIPLTNVIRYVDNILKSTPSSLDQVTVDPDGKWHITRDDDNTMPGGNPSPSTDDGDDDLIEIQDSHVVTLKQEPSTTPMALQSTPSAQSRELPSIQSASRPTPSNKRPVSQVIDLTISDDEDEEPPRPAKRPHIQPSPSQYSKNRYSDFASGASMSNASFGLSSQSGSNSPAPNSFYYDA